MPRRAHVVMQH